MRTLLLTALLLLVLVPAAGAADETPRRVALRAAVLKDVRLIPVTAWLPVTSALPASLAPGTYAVDVGQRGIRIDCAGSGRRQAKVSRRKPQVVHVGAERPYTPIWIRAEGQRWLAAPADTREGKVGKTAVLFLGTRLDAEGQPTRGWMRWGTGAFRPLLSENVVQVGAAWHRLRLLSVDGTLQLDVASTPLSADLPADQRTGLLAVNAFRNDVGLEPIRLDATRSQACQAHAEYILKNPVDGLGHKQIPGRPGYSEAGQEAARLSVMALTGDPRKAVTQLTSMMLHRIPFLHAPNHALGVGAVHRSPRPRPDSPPGFTVLWAGVTGSSKTFPVLVPAAGQRDVPRLCEEEIPTPEAHPHHYDSPRGYPISVSFVSTSVDGIAIDLQSSKERDLTAGLLFTPRAPIHSAHAHNQHTAFFLPDKPLAPGTVYAATFRAVVDGSPVRFAWTFVTAK